jgi:hypothetical protein
MATSGRGSGIVGYNVQSVAWSIMAGGGTYSAAASLAA